MVIEITMHEVESMLQYAQDQHRAMVIMFYGATCGPCKASMPFYEEVAEYFQSKNAKFDFYRINAWEPAEQHAYCKETWSIAGVPQFKIFYNRQILVDRAGGGDFETMKNVLLPVIDTVFTTHGVKL